MAIGISTATIATPNAKSSASLTMTAMATIGRSSSLIGSSTSRNGSSNSLNMTFTATANRTTATNAIMNNTNNAMSAPTILPPQLAYVGPGRELQIQRGRGPGGVLEAECQGQRADGHFVAFPQHDRAVDPRSVDPRSVLAAEVLEAGSAGGEADSRVFARNAAGVQGHRAAWIAADDTRTVDERIRTQCILESGSDARPGVHGAFECVSQAVCGTNQIGADRIADLGDQIAHIGFFDRDIGPQRLDDFFLRDDPRPLRDEHSQKLKCFRRER